MYIIQLLTGILFTLLGGTAGYLGYIRQNNAFLAAAGLFLLIAVSCYLLALGTRRRDKMDQVIPEPEEMEYEDGYYESDYEYEETGDPEEYAEKSEEAAAGEYDGYEEYDPDPEDYSDEYSYYEETDEEAFEESEEGFEEPETMDFSPFYLAYIKDLLPIQQEIVHSNTTASLDDQPIESMSTEELEGAIERTQVALNALTRLRMFCETRGTGGPEYYDEAMERYESDPYFLTPEMLNEQMNALRKVYDESQGIESPVTSEENVFTFFPENESTNEESAEEPLYEEAPLEEAEETFEEIIEETVEETVEETFEEETIKIEENYVIEENGAAEEDHVIADEIVFEEIDGIEGEPMESAEPAEEEFPEEPEFFEEDAAPEESVEEPEISLEAMIEEDWLEEALTEEPVSIYPFEVEAAEEAVFEESADEPAADESAIEEPADSNELEFAEEADSDEPAEENDAEDEASEENASEEELSPFEQLSIDENDIGARVLHVVSQNEGIHPSDLIHSFEPTLKKQVKKALYRLLDDEVIEKRRVGFSHGLFVVPYTEENSDDSEE